MTKKDFIGIGIIGAGFARSTQIPGFRACANARVVSIASAHRENAARVASEFGIEHVANDWRELIARDDVDLVSIVTPPATHLEMTLAALDAGKDVLCEKPMAMNAREADEMRVRAHERKAFALIDHELRFLAGRGRMREMLLKGEIGRVRHVKFTFRTDSRAQAERPWNWWSDAAQGGGVLGAIGSHAVDSFHWLLGANVSQVSASLAAHTKERTDKATGEMRAVTADDEANLLLRFADSALTNNTTGVVSMSMVESGAPEHRLEIFGERGALMVKEPDELWHSTTGSGQWTHIETPQTETAQGMRDSGWARGFTTFARRIVEALQEGAQSVEGAATFDDGYETQLVLDAARLSHESGAWTAINKQRTDAGME